MCYRSKEYGVELTYKLTELPAQVSHRAINTRGYDYQYLADTKINMEEISQALSLQRRRSRL